MLVTSLKEAALVLRYLRERWVKTGLFYLAADTETEASKPFPKEDALTVGRAKLKIWSCCFRGDSFSFPTSLIDAQYPTAAEWGEFLTPLVTDRKFRMVFHNWNYDAQIFFYEMGLANICCKLWDTMIGAWIASETQAKGLKELAPALGRFLRETKTIDFSNLAELAEYAEQDVVATDELFQVQNVGRIVRPKVLLEKLAVRDGRLALSVRPNPLYAAPFTPDRQTLPDYGNQWAVYQELPYLKAVISAEQRGVPFDVPHLRQIRVKAVDERRRALEKVFSIAGIRFNPRSPKEMELVIIKRLGIKYPYKTKKGNYTWKANYLMRMMGAHPIFEALINLSKLQKLIDVYIGTEALNATYDSNCGLERWVNPKTGRIHCSLSTLGAITGRNSASRPNLQQIPSKRDIFGLRECFVAMARRFT